MNTPALFALILSAGLTVTPAAAEITLINVFEVPEGERAATVSAWENARDFLATQPGYVSTSLHGAAQPGERFELINIAKWESRESFLAATQAMRKAKIFVAPNGVVAHPALYHVIATD